MLHKISVVVTNHNYGRFLGRCLRSLLSQSIDHTQFEIVVVDDCSTDNSIEILNSFGSQIRVLTLNQNMGLAYASNAGIRLCVSRYIVRVDADDYVHPKFLETLLLGFELMGGDFEAISCDYFKVDQAGNYLSYGSQVSEPIACAIAFKIDAFEAVGLYDSSLRLNEEIDLRLRFEKANMKLYNIGIPLYRYVQHDDSLTRRVPK